MCDYSLESQMSRDAQLGDILVTSRFANSSTQGFAAANAPNVAVCLKPGTELAFSDNIQTEGFLRNIVNSYSTSEGCVATFRKINEQVAHSHHDALELPNGQIYLLACLRTGQSAQVISLPPTAEPTAKRVSEHFASQPQGLEQPVTLG